MLLLAVQAFKLCSVLLVSNLSGSFQFYLTLEPLLTSADECSTPRDAIARSANLWGIFAADLLTDLLSKLKQSHAFIHARTRLTTVSGLVMVIPLHILYTIRVSTAQKLSAGIVFIFGIITIIAGIMRITSLWSSIQQENINTLWSVIESGVGVYTLLSILGTVR